MPRFPASPIAPAAFLEQFVPEAFAELELPAALRALDVEVGVLLAGEGGGEWVMRLREGALAVEACPRDSAGLSVVQSVADWRGALWEGRGGPFGRRAAQLFGANGAALLSGAAAPGMTRYLGAASQLRSLDGLIGLVVTGGGAEDWRLGVKLGPGPLPEQPTTTVSVSADDAEALEAGSLNPIEAFMAGRIQVAGDVALVMQIQGILLSGASD